MKQRLAIDDLRVAKALYEAAQRYPEGAYGRWHKISEELNATFGLDKKPTTWRAMWSKLRVRYGMITSDYYGYMSKRPMSELTGDNHEKPCEASGSVEPIITINLSEKRGTQQEGHPEGFGEVLKLLSKKQTMQDMVSSLKLPPKVVLAYLDALKDSGYQIVEVNGLYWNEKKPLLKENVIRTKWDGERIIRFGVVSDTHLGNKHQQLTFLSEFYDRCAELGIDTVYHGGDISDGFYPNRPEQIFELHAIGLEAQAEYIIEYYPRRKGITTKFITGNHDGTHMRNGGGSIGRRIEIERPDMEYLGHGKVKVWLTPNCDMDIVHPNGGKSYALSHKLQKAIDAMPDGAEPCIFLMGHFHAFCYIFFRNVHAFMLPGFQAQNPWAELGFLQFQVGGIIYEVRVNDNGEIVSMQPTLYQFYTMKENDY